MKRTIDILTTIEGAIATLAYSCVAILLMGDVIGRELFGISVLGIKTVAVYVAIVAGFLGLVLATNHNAHLRPEIFDHLITGRRGAMFDRIGDLLSGLFFLFLAGYAIYFVGQTRAAGDRAAVLYFLLWPIQLIIPYAFLSSALRHFAFCVSPILKSKSQDR